MISEDYVSFEVAKLLKEKGFSELTTKAYPYFEGKDYKYDISCPTLQMAMKWLREVHKIGIFPSTYSHTKGEEVTHNYGVAIVSLKNYSLLTDEYCYSSTYEEACEAAIKYCLENLI